MENFKMNNILKSPLFANCAHASDPQDLLQRLTALSQAECSEQSYLATVTRNPMKQPDGSVPKGKASVFRVARRPDHVMISSDTHTICINPKYGFKLEKKEGGWLLNQMVPGIDADGEGSRYQYETHVGKAESMTVRPLTSSSSIQSFFEPLSNTTLVVESTGPPNEAVLKYQVTSGELRFDTVMQCTFAGDRHVLTSATRRSSSMPKYEFLFKRELDERGSRSRSIEEVLVERGKSEVLQLERCDYSEYTAKAPPDSEFYLTHYGLPEPVGISAPRKPFPLYIWLLSGAAVLALIAVLCRWLLQRRTRAAVVVPPATA